ncbi:glycosyltransferase family 2 protein [Cetobacterium somerae]|uniref:glycosyltransferase family 2 protein n=1 Tax=Cetobacterium somerae TaxID=188913 RepID=UPI00211DD5D9
MDKKISVIMGIYNCSDTLEEAINSILNQSYKNWELIMCDDASTDKTYEIAKKYEQIYPEKIKLIKNKKNLTLGPTLNRCLEIVSGDYIARQDGDDLSHELRFEKQVKFLEENKKYDLVGTNMYSYDGTKILGVRKNNLEIPKKTDLVKCVPFYHATILIKKKCFDNLNGYSLKKTRRRLEDIDLWFRFFEKGYRGYNLQEALYYVREDGSQYKRRNFKNYLNATITCIVGAKNLNLPWTYYLYSLSIVLKYFVPIYFKKKYHERTVEVTNA